MEQKSKKALVEKWSNVKGQLSIADIEDPYVRENTAQLLENQSTQFHNLLTEATTFNQGAPTSNATGQFQPISLALVRRTFPELFCHKVVPTQAINGPVGLAYVLRFVYNDGKEAGFEDVPTHSGYSGDQTATTGAADTGLGEDLATAEAFQLPPGTGNMPQVKLELARTAIEAKTRKLAASFSLEAAQDLKAMHNIEIEHEILSILQYEVMAELDRELCFKLRDVAVNGDGGEAAATVSVSGSDGRWSQEKFAVITNTIVAKANAIAIKTRRAAGNFVIVGPNVATALQAAGRAFTGNTADVNPTNTLANIGTINGTITVWRDSYITSDSALVGYKGPGVADGGIIYSPYVTGMMSKAIAEEDFSPRMGVMSRYAITDSLLGAGRYYRLINYTDLASVIGV